jgi:peroxiredoxin family protein
VGMLRGGKKTWYNNDMASKNTELEKEMMEKRMEAYLNAWKEAMVNLNKEHEYKAHDGSIMSFDMLPKLQADDYSIKAVYGIGHTRREEVTVGKEPEADGQSDRDDTVS